MKNLVLLLTAATAILAQDGVTRDNWPSYGGTHYAWRHSALDQINTGNISRLVPVWTFQTGDYENGLQATPIVVDGVMHLSTSRNWVFALDAATGKVLWEYRYQAPKQAPIYGTAKRSPPPGIQRGRELFFDAARIASCGSCHELDGWGVAVGPDLMATSLKDAAALRAVRQARVKTARPKAERPFPALPVEQAKGEVSVYDLTGPLPVLRVFPAVEVTLADGATWSHAAATRIYPDSELASILAYLRWLTAH